jgi:thioredoxin
MKTLLALLAILPALTVFAGNDNVSKNKKENSMKPIELTKESFVKLVYNYEASPNVWKYEGDKPCIIDFYATWCGPCKMLAPSLEKISEEYNGKLIVYKVDVDKNPELAGMFGIRSVPTLLWIPLNGTPSLSQGSSKEPLDELVKSTLLKTK